MYAKLTEYIADRKEIPFEWGKNDCCLFVGDWVALATGEDVAADFRGKYSNEKGAFKLLFKQGLNDVKSIFKARLNPEINPYYARRGDLALVRHNGELVGGIIQINAVACVGDNGLIHLPLTDVDSVFPLFQRNTGHE